MEPLVKGPASPEGYQAILATSDLAVGENRIGFVLTSEDGFVTVPAVRVTPRLLDSSGTIQEEQAPVQAMYQAWPYGNRGLHAARISFARPGRWELSIQVEEPGKPASAVKLTFDVRDSTLAPNEGESAVKSRTRTASDVKSLAELTTGSLRDGDLYQVSIADAVSGGKPAVVVFASPAFCINAVCGPQVDVLQELKNSYKGQGSFIHVDFYENPDKIQGDLGRAQVATAVKEWKLPSIEWTFVIDKNGVVRARFEGFATYSEVEQAFKQVL
ncbi:MAG: hypothetical protein FJ319_12010 [SAR202 cluster bacterium]|nr:hypothetical protein [SAR202 cluster bacterium]